MTMKFDVLTLFPAMLAGPVTESILGKALQRGVIRLDVHSLRDWAEGRHQVTDDTPYGGGDGMVMKVEPMVRALADIRSRTPATRVLLMSPQGRPFRQADAGRLSRQPALTFVCGRYEGFDERIRDYVDEELSLGDFVMTGGELAAMAMIDAVSRLVPGVLGSPGSAQSDSHSDGLLEYPQYTRPAEFQGRRVPDVLLSGNHQRIADWRRREQLRRTLQRRPELLASAHLNERDQQILQQLRQETDQGET